MMPQGKPILLSNPVNMCITGDIVRQVLAVVKKTINKKKNNLSGHAKFPKSLHTHRTAII